MACDELIEYCRSKPFATADYPFDPATLVVRVGGKLSARECEKAGPPPKAPAPRRRSAPEIRRGRA